jgi:hypothetical protein
MVNIIIPKVKIFFIPWISAILPNGTANMAADNKKALVTQFNSTASAPKSNPMVGSAMLMEDPMKGVKKEAMVATRSAAILI